MVAWAGDVGGMGKMAGGEWERQASISGMNESRGWEAQQREYGQWCCDSVVVWQVGAMLVVSPAWDADLSNHLKLRQQCVQSFQLYLNKNKFIKRKLHKKERQEYQRHFSHRELLMVANVPLTSPHRLLLAENSRVSVQGNFSEGPVRTPLGAPPYVCYNLCWFSIQLFGAALHVVGQESLMMWEYLL